MATTWSQKESGHTTLTHAYEGLMSWGCPPYYSSMLSDLRLEKAEKAFCCIEGMALSLPSLAPSGGRWLVHRPQAMLSPITQNFQNKQNQSNKNPTASKPPPLKFPRMSHDKGKWEGFRSQAPEIWQLPPLQQAHPDTTGTAAGSGRHWAAGGFLFWKQNPADIEAAESGEGTLCFSLEKPGERWNHSNLNPNFAPVLEKIERRKTQEGLASLWRQFSKEVQGEGRGHRPNKHSEDCQEAFLSPWIPSNHQRDFTSLCPQKEQTVALLTKPNLSAGSWLCLQVTSPTGAKLRLGREEHHSYQAKFSLGDKTFAGLRDSTNHRANSSVAWWTIKVSVSLQS